MGRVLVSFEGLCVLFTKQLDSNPPILSVGLVKVDYQNRARILNDLAKSNQGVMIDKEDLHLPRILINEVDNDGKTTPFWTSSKNMDGEQVWSAISGNISLDIFPEPMTPLKKSSKAEIDDSDFLKTNLKLATLRYKAQIAEGRPNLHFNIPSVSEHLFPPDIIDDTKRPRPLLELCSARVTIKSGILFSRDDFDMQFGKTKFIEGPVNHLEGEVKHLSITPLLEFVVPEEGCAVLSFDYDGSSVRLLGNKQYEVRFINQSEGSKNQPQGEERNHFLYFYSVFSQVPEDLITPRPVGPQGSTNNPYCTGLGEP